MPGQRPSHPPRREGCAGRARRPFRAPRTVTRHRMRLRVGRRSGPAPVELIERELRRMPSEVAAALVVENAHVKAEILPAQGGRVRSLHDRVEDRELLYLCPAAEWNPDDYLATLAGGWDQMFPNDDPWQTFPTHGVLWSSAVEGDHVTEETVTLRCEVEQPSASVVLRYSLLPPPRRGLRLETTVHAHASLPACLWATHPMLAVDTGWRIDPGTADVEADDVDPGRAAPGAVCGALLDRVLTVPPPSQGWQEVLYMPGGGSASVASADGSVGTLVQWDTDFFPSLWVVTLSGFQDVDLAVVLEPCTSRPYRLGEAAAAGTAKSLVAGETYRF